MSPELFNPDQTGPQRSRPTVKSDCYALGMVTLEVLSGQVPFAYCTDLVVMWKVLGGKHPERPKGVEGVWFTDNLWEMLKLCWETQPTSRPSIETMLECFVQVSRVWRPPSPLVDGDSTEVDKMGEDVETDEDEMDEDIEMDGIP
jgi:hypothetical protein